MTTDLDRFIACMQYEPSDRRPNHELGVWPQTRIRWGEEAAGAVAPFGWDWFVGEPAIGLDRREYIPVHYGFIPPFPEEVIEDTPEYEIVRSGLGIVSKGLKAGAAGGGRMCMDQYIEFPVKGPGDFALIRKRLIAGIPERYPADLDARIAAGQARECPLVLGVNCAANGFYWRAREWMGTENLSVAFCEQPSLVHEMMEFYADFIIETSRPVLDRIQFDYFCLNEDFAMKSGPLLSPDQYKEFIVPHLRRMVEFFRSHGTRYFVVDSDGDPTLLIPLMLDAGVDTIWPLERAAGISPHVWRRKFGKSLRMWGGVDKRELTKSRECIRQHLLSFAPLIEEGGFIPTVDHTVPPDVPWDHFRYYMDCKQALLAGEYHRI